MTLLISGDRCGDHGLPERPAPGRPRLIPTRPSEDDIALGCLRVGLVGSCDLIRVGLDAMLSSPTAVARTGTSAGAGLTRGQVDASDVDIVLVDTAALPMASAAERVHDLVRSGFEAVVALGWQAQLTVVDRQLFVEAGARGYVSLRLSASDLVAALLQLTSAPPAAAARHRCPDGPPLALALELAGFTPREAAVFTLICRGLSNQDIAEDLLLSINTVKSYIRNAYRKVGVTSRGQAVSWGLNRGGRRVSDPVSGAESGGVLADVFTLKALESSTGSGRGQACGATTTSSRELSAQQSPMPGRREAVHV